MALVACILIPPEKVAFLFIFAYNSSMTLEQQILALIHKLPEAERVRVALTILKGVDPSQIEVNQDKEMAHPWETPEFFEELNKRLDDMVSGKDPGVLADQVFKDIAARLS